MKIDFHTYAGEVKAIRDVSFHLNEGETLAIVGESGSGKSVTTRSIIGLLARNAQIMGGEIIFTVKIYWIFLKKNGKKFVVMKLP